MAKTQLLGEMSLLAVCFYNYTFTKSLLYTAAGYKLLPVLLCAVQGDVVGAGNASPRLLTTVLFDSDLTQYVLQLNCGRSFQNNKATFANKANVFKMSDFNHLFIHKQRTNNEANNKIMVIHGRILVV